VTSIEGLLGSYEGSGAWHDSTGKSAGYSVRQTNSPAPDGFEIIFTHNFTDGTVVDARFRMTWTTGHIFRVATAGAPIGHGYVFERFCHYHLETGKAFVEASYRFHGDTVEVFGSSTTNAEGHYIAWKEILRRIA
jgi:hypothetical protein